MSKADTISALKRSAIENFAKQGFEGASLRAISADAGVPLSAVHIYFGSKAELYVAVGDQAWNELQDERMVIYRRCTAETAPQLRDLIYALAYPVVLRAMSKREYDTAELLLIRAAVWQRPHSRDTNEWGDRAIQYWINQTQAICPYFTQAEAIWAYSLMVSAIYNWQLIDHRFDKFLPDDAPSTFDNFEDVLEDLICFCVDGIKAMMARRQTPPGD